ncbi:hypothetical protein LIER_21491 [Lithospermum erythrorhizon]|uniref:Fibronectin type-III domain-containing protein n=1 Tax=Lithospermum erythrorhizon TaxID=34254 RepID=A0AAV3QTW2_LITER
MFHGVYLGLGFDASTCCNWSVQEKTELVYGLSERLQEASEVLQAWSRQDILEILCAEMGKERKYTGLTKSKLIENLMKIVNEKKSQQSSDLKLQSSSDISQWAFKRPRKNDSPNDDDSDLANTVYCKNSACKAILNQGDAFCKRCSCCICRLYDDNKDPSLWLVCSSEQPFGGESCGMSSHLECSIKHERSCIGKEVIDDRLDGAFRCVSCGKVNDILGSCRKQLIIARDTRRVDIMCYRLSLCQKILSNTKCYLKIHEIVEECISKLEADVGPLTGLPVKKARGIVNRLSSGPEIQKLCTRALESLDSIGSTCRSIVSSGTSLQECSTMPSEIVRIEDVCSSSLTVVLCPQVLTGQKVVRHMLWHRKAQDPEYPQEPTCTLFAPTTRFSLSNLTSETDYFLKIVTLDTDRELETREVQIRTYSSSDGVSNQSSKEVDRSQSPTTNYSSLSNPSSVEDETNNLLPCNNEIGNKGDNYLAYFENNCKISSADLFHNFTNCSSESPGDKVLLLQKSNGTGKLVPAPSSKTTNLESNYPPDGRVVEEMSTSPTGLECVPYIGNSESHLPITPPCKLENMKKIVEKSNGIPKPHSSSKVDLDCGSGREEEPQTGSSSKKRSAEQRDVECTEIRNKDFEYYVKVIRWLECEGHVEKSFREKFLTWYSLRAKPQEVRIVKVFVDTLIEDPESLAGQLVDTFSDVISNKRSCMVSAGFCHKLWH